MISPLMDPDVPASIPSELAIRLFHLPPAAFRLPRFYEIKELASQLLEKD